MNIVIIGYDEETFEPLMSNPKIKNLYLLYKSGVDESTFHLVYKNYINYSKTHLIMYNDILDELENISDISLVYINLIYSLYYTIKIFSVIDKKTKLLILSKKIKEYENELYATFFKVKSIDKYLYVSYVPTNINTLKFLDYIVKFEYDIFNDRYSIDINENTNMKIDIKYTDILPPIDAEIHTKVYNMYILKKKALQGLFYIDQLGTKEEAEKFIDKKITYYFYIYRQLRFFSIVLLDYTNVLNKSKKKIEFLHNTTNADVERHNESFRISRLFMKKAYNKELISRYTHPNSTPTKTKEYSLTKTWDKPVDIIFVNLKYIRSPDIKKYITEETMATEYINIYSKHTIEYLKELEYYTHRLHKGGKFLTLMYPLLNTAQFHIIILYTQYFEKVYIKSHIEHYSNFIIVECINFKGVPFKCPVLSENMYISQIYNQTFMNVNINTEKIKRIIANIYIKRYEFALYYYNNIKNIEKSKNGILYHIYYIQSILKYIGVGFMYDEFNKDLIAGGFNTNLDNILKINYKINLPELETPITNIWERTDIQVNTVLQKMYSEQAVYDKNNKKIKYNSGVGPVEGWHLYNLVKSNQFNKILEVGMAYGTSALFMCQALKENNAPGYLISIDPNQSTQWEGIGRLNIERAGLLKYHRIMETTSDKAMAYLLSSNIDGDAPESFDMVFVDGMHLFDYTLLDIYFAAKLVRLYGVIVIDDIRHKGVAKAIKYINLNYKFLKLIEINVASQTMATYVKIADDTRLWNFHIEF